MRHQEMTGGGHADLRRTFITEVGSLNTIAFFWCASLAVTFVASTWLASSNSNFGAEFFEWAMAFARILLPPLIALSVAGPIARLLFDNGWRKSASLVLVALAIAVALGLMFAEGQMPISPSVASKKQTIFSFLDQFHSGRN